jgi:hypothetical protein
LNEIAGLPFCELHFDEAGALTKRVSPLPPHITDLFVFAHGWNNDYTDASDLHENFFEQLAAELVEQEPQPGVRVALVGVYWPSALWPDEEPPIVETTGFPLFGPVDRDWTEELKKAFRAPAQRAALDRMRELVDERPANPESVAEFRRLLATIGPGVEPLDFDALADTAPPERVEETPLPASVIRLWRGAKEAVRVTSYAAMRARATVVGEAGLRKYLEGLRSSIRVHLIGHGLGGRLVAAAVGEGLPNVYSLVLLEESRGEPGDPEIVSKVLAAAGLASAGLASE